MRKKSVISQWDLEPLNYDEFGRLPVDAIAMDWELDELFWDEFFNGEGTELN